jgi:hypothetical protein
MLLAANVRAVELSALRENELDPMIAGIAELKLSHFEYISVHAPSAFKADNEEAIVSKLLKLCVRRRWPVVLHPDAVYDASLWRKLGSLLCIENTDKRKPIGRTVGELNRVFEHFPEASFCFDIGHARQVDATMTESYLMLKKFGSRVRQVHVSEVNTRSKHDPLSLASILAFREVSDLISPRIPLILETPVEERQLTDEMKKTEDAFPVRELAIAD